MGKPVHGGGRGAPGMAGEVMLGRTIT